MCSRYSFKPKKQKVDDVDDETLKESVRTLSSLLSLTTDINALGDSSNFASSSEALQAHVATLSAEIAAAFAEAQSRLYGANDEGANDEEDNEEGSSSEAEESEGTGLVGSDNRNERDEASRRTTNNSIDGGAPGGEGTASGVGTGEPICRSETQKTTGKKRKR